MAGLILAAGASSRLGGRSKTLLPYGTGTILRAVVERAGAAGLDPLVLVLRHDSHAFGVGPGRAFTPAVVPVINPSPDSGIGGSVVTGVLELMGRDVDGAAVLLADEPDVEVRAIERVIEEWRRSGADVTRALYRDRPGHPVVFSRSTFALLSALPPTARVLSEVKRAGLVLRHAHLEFDAPDDIDTAVDYLRAITRSLQALPASAERSPTAAELHGSPRR